MKVLLAHTSPTFIQEVSELFGRLDWELLHAADGLEAERLCRSEHPDVAVLDAELDWPRDGSLVEHFRADSVLRRVRVLVLARELELEEALTRLDDGVEYVLEPVTPAELAVRVKTLERMRVLEARLDDQHAELRDLLHADPLTGLLDRRFVARQLGAQVNGARRHGQPLSILLVDLDRLKGINDTLGHAAGDEALKAVARVLEERLRDTDLAGRWGGDEFLVILPATGFRDAMTVANDLVAATAAITDAPARLTLSIGCAEWQEEDPPELLERADRALYDAKRGGRNRVVSLLPRQVEMAMPSVPKAGDAHGLRVLLVDDSDTIRKLLRLTLEGAGAEIVGEATDGEEAVGVAVATEPDLVIMDWNMPVADGIQGTRAVLDAVPDTTVVSFSSTDDPRILNALFEAGAEANFNKSAIEPMLEFVVARAQLAVSSAASTR